MHPRISYEAWQLAPARSANVKGMAKWMNK